MCIHDNQFQVTPLSIHAYFEYVEQAHRERTRRLEAYQLEMALRDAEMAERTAHTRFVRMFRIRQALNRWAPRLAARLML